MEEHIVYSKHVLEFVTIAAEYCSFVESTEQFSKKSFFEKSQKLLSVLYLKATILPKIEAFSEEGNEKFVSEADWFFIKEKIVKKIASHEMFIEVYSPLISKEDDVENISLSEVFADIYQDLMDFVSLYRIGHEESMNDALWECQQHFEQYWGGRLLAALTAIHNILYGGDDLLDETIEPQTQKETDTSNWIFTQRQKDWGINE